MKTARLIFAILVKGVMEKYTKSTATYPLRLRSTSSKAAATQDLEAMAPVADGPQGLQ